MKNILIVFGGMSYEHDISVVTAFQIMKKARLENVNLVLFYVSRENKFFICNKKNVKISDFSSKNFKGKNKNFKEVSFVSGEKKKIFMRTRFGLKEYIHADAAIFCSHGGDGENGRLVSYFELNGVPCSAGTSDALAVCMDKTLFKNTMKGLKVPVVAGFAVDKNDYLKNKNCFENYLKFYKFPLIVKVNSGGSSIGVFVAENMAELDEKLLQAFELDDRVVVEKFIRNAREFNVAVIGDKENYEVSEIDEPIKDEELLSFADKYLKSDSKCGKGGKSGMDTSKRKFPADIDDGLKIKMQTIAGQIFAGLGLRGVVRIDFLYDAANDKVYVCEVNAIPGSLAYYFFKKNKIVTNDLILRLISIAEKGFENRCFDKNFVTNILDT